MENDSRANLPNWFLKGQRQKLGWDGGYVNLMMEKHIPRSLSTYHLGRNPLQQNHTHKASRDWD